MLKSAKHFAKKLLPAMCQANQNDAFCIQMDSRKEEWQNWSNAERDNMVM